VRTIMLTGDHVLTARSIARDLGFSDSPEAIIEGREIEALSEQQLAERLKHVQIGARVNPEHKMRIIAALQLHGEVVAMTGDGVNDAPALKEADIGVALNAGTDIAKSASDLVLLDNSFSVIVAAIRQGRIAFDNIRKVTIFLLFGSFSELIMILAPLIANSWLAVPIPLPLTAVQILWTNLVEDSLPNVALSFEPGETDVMERRPLAKSEPVLDKEAKIIIFAAGIFTDLVLLGVFVYLYFATSLSIEHIRTIVFAGLGLDTFFYIFSIKSLRQPIYHYNVFSNKYLNWATVIGIGLMIAAVHVPLLNGFLGTVPLRAIDWLLILGIGIIQILAVESVKWWFFHRTWGRRDTA
jgi:P-type Ca2+ transporter type 2C